MFYNGAVAATGAKAPMAFLAESLGFLWTSLLLLGPMLLFGLFLAGLIHVLVSRDAVLRWLRDDNLKSVAAAAAVGVPVPLCSCSVVPVVAEMRRKGAARSPCMSFLITAPETGADSILVTHAFFGFVAAIVRPVVSFVTAVVSGLFCIGMVRDEHEAAKPSAPGGCGDAGDCERGRHAPLVPGAADCYVSLRQLKASLRGALAGAAKSRAPAIAEVETAPPGRDRLQFKAIVKHVLRYGFVELADDILFALLVGIVLGAVLYLAIPGAWLTHEHARWLAYPAMLLIGVPLYICASASTPIAAALVAKGLSPGAALIFLMTGPATNTGTIAIIVSQFGTRFAAVYVGAVVVVTVTLGILIDVLILAAGWSLVVNLEASDSHAVAFVQWSGALGLLALLVWRFRAGAFKSGYREMLANLRPLAGR